MTFQILQSNNQIKQARAELKRSKLSFVAPGIVRQLRTRGLLPGINVGDYIKSWDLLLTLNFIQAHVDRSAGVLDIGAYASEILASLHRAGYTHLAGADLNPNLKQMPFADQIQYEITDFMKTPFPSASFQAVTAISVIEHGFDGERLFSEAARLLKPNGYFIASFDYWPQKIDTTGIDIFGMSWTIFSKEDVQNMLEIAGRHGLRLYGEGQFDTSTTPVMDFFNKSYSFAWMCLQKI